MLERFRNREHQRLLADFLVIGAQKSGTSTLYADLAAQDAVCMSTIKEPSVLVRFPDEKEATKYYARQFEPRHSGQLLGEASTEYTMLPRHQGVPALARRVLGPDLRLVYLVRNPIERAISHHHHAFSRGVMGPDIDEAVRTEPWLIEFGRYAMQLDPWIASFGMDRLLVVRFEDYIKDRPATVVAVGRHLGIDVDPARLSLDQVFNRSEGNYVGRGWWRRAMISTDLYRLWLRRLMPDRLRKRLRRILFAEAPPRPRPPRPDTVDVLIERLAPDADRLAAMLGWKAPIWDLEATRRKYAELAAAAPSSTAVGGGA